MLDKECWEDCWPGNPEGIPLASPPRHPDRPTPPLRQPSLTRRKYGDPTHGRAETDLFRLDDWLLKTNPPFENGFLICQRGWVSTWIIAYFRSLRRWHSFNLGNCKWSTIWHLYAEMMSVHQRRIFMIRMGVIWKEVTTCHHFHFPKYPSYIRIIYVYHECTEWNMNYLKFSNFIFNLIILKFFISY